MPQRTRSKTEGPVLADIYKHRTGFPPLLVASGVTLSAIQHGMIDTVTPGYQKLVASGAIVNSPCSYTKVSSTSKGGYTASGRLNEVVEDHYTGGSISYFAVPLSYIPDNVDRGNASVAEAKLAAIANMDSTPFAFGEDLGEIASTLRFLKNPIKSLTDISRDMKALEYKKIRKGVRAAQASADAYATYQWAYQPLMRSVEDLTLALLTATGSAIKRSSSRGFSEFTSSDSNDEFTDLDPLIFGYKRTIEEKVHATILYENFRDDNGTLKKYGLRMKDVPETAWQLFPLSFMVDRVVNVTNVISATQNLLDSDLRVLCGSVTIRRKEELTWTVKQFYRDNVVVKCVGDTYNQTVFTYTREPWTPSMFDLVPPFQPANLVKDASSILDLTSILLSRLTNKG